MSVKEVTYHQVECDGCGADAHEGGDFSAYYDSGRAIEDAADSDWLTEVGNQRLDFCPDCLKGTDTPEAEACGDHVDLSKVGDQWVCDACETSFGPPVAWSGWELGDREALLAQVDQAGVTLRHEVVVCDHVTLSYPDTVRPAPVQAVVVGIASDVDIQALVVAIDGRHVRPDGNIYHVTLSRRPDVPDHASKGMLQRAFADGAVTWFRPWPIPTSPILRRS